MLVLCFSESSPHVLDFVCDCLSCHAGPVDSEIPG